jgi:regulator of protease activity HflC (stomatin/prohibitin superfamily)
MKKTKIALVLLLSIGLTSCYDFDREQAEKDATSEGKQILLKSESSKKAKIEQAKADLESAKLEAETRLIEAEAKAKSINAISKSLKDNPEYLKYLMIEGMNKGKNKVYIPTEANLPILEINK